jgi:predicted dehydrogenase
MESRVKVAIIGAGYTANEHLKAFTDIKDVELSGIFSRTRERAENLAKNYSVKGVYDSIEELWEKSEAQIVVITVNEPSMPQTIKDCLKYGWHLIAEKPPALSVEEAEELLKITEKKNKKVHIALNRASYSVTRYVVGEIEKKEGNRVIIVQDQEDPERALNLGQPKEVTERWMYANSIHLFDYFRIFGRGEAKKVQTSGELDGNKPCFIESHIEFDSGDYGVYQAFWNEPAPWAVTVHLPDARYELRPLEEGKRQIRWGKPEEMDVDEWDKKFKPGFRRQAEEMVKIAMGESGEVPTLEDAIKTMKLIKEVYKI